MIINKEDSEEMRASKRRANEEEMAKEHELGALRLPLGIPKRCKVDQPGDVKRREWDYRLGDAQYTNGDWRNRNLIKTACGLKWISIPVLHSLDLKINEVKVLNSHWRKKHWLTLKYNYSKSKYFNKYRDSFQDLYLNSDLEFISDINYSFIKLVNRILDITTKISFSSDYHLEGGKSEKPLNICKQVGADEFVLGPTAKSYLNQKLFKKEKIKLTWMNYSNYRTYSQLYYPFNHNVSIVDLIFNEGPNATQFLKSF